MNINEDPILTGYVRHILKTGDNWVGSNVEQGFKLGGLGIGQDHCTLTLTGEKVVLKANKKYKTIVNGQLITQQTNLNHGDLVLFGSNNLYVMIFPSWEMEFDLDYQTCMKKQMQN